MPRKSKATLAKETASAEKAALAARCLTKYPHLFLTEDDNKIQDADSADLVAGAQMGDTNEEEVDIIEYAPVAIRKFKRAAVEVKE
jgi:hypothetical protein